ncbi:metal-dependent hydrolase [Halobacteriaceae archaeon GCM10025711]
MWPWEHLAFGYLAYSVWSHVWDRRSPTGPAVLVLAVATQLPDLVDKPLGWSLDVVSTGYSVAHSVLVAGPLVLGAVLVSHRRGRPALGGALAIGWASHLVGDIVYPVLFGRGISVGKVLWPVVSLPASDGEFAFSDRVVYYFVRYLREAAEPGQAMLLVFPLTLLLAVFALWGYDGWPGLGTLRRMVT